VHEEIVEEVVDLELIRLWTQEMSAQDRLDSASQEPLGLSLVLRWPEHALRIRELGRLAAERAAHVVPGPPPLAALVDVAVAPHDRPPLPFDPPLVLRCFFRDLPVATILKLADEAKL
jgi:hypothetical protein